MSLYSRDRSGYDIRKLWGGGDDIIRKIDLNRSILEGILRRALRDMEQDSHRSARNLVDMGLLFAKGPFERRFLAQCKDVLEDTASPYYTAINRALTKCDRDTLVTFGINLGLEGCSRGARRIREAEARHGFQVPWALEIFAGSDGLSRVYVQRLVSEAVALGVRVFFLRDCGLDQGELELLLRENQTCAFGLFTTGSRGDYWDLSRLRQHHNLVLSISAGAPLARPFCKALEENRMPYCVHLDCAAYDDTLPQRIEAAGELDGLVVILLSQEAEPDARQKIQDMVLRDRAAYPFGLLHFPGDLLAIDQVISSGPCSLSFLPDGSARTRKGPMDSNIRTASLSQILGRELPRLPK